jgi:3-methyladenine DNA glycosylase AlkD/TfoX/Sxy family transcriptional regulator of competence genes
MAGDVRAVVKRVLQRAAADTLREFLDEQVSAAVRPLAGVGRRKMLVSFGFTVNDRVFALVSRQSRIVVRAPDAALRAELSKLGATPWKVGTRAAPRDWLQLPETMHDDSEALAIWLRRAWELGRDRAGAAVSSKRRRASRAKTPADVARHANHEPAPADPRGTAAGRARSAKSQRASRTQVSADFEKHRRDDSAERARASTARPASRAPTRSGGMRREVAGSPRAPVFDVDPARVELLRELEAAGDPARAAQEKRYLKSELRFLGTGLPAIRRTAKAFVRAHPEMDRDAVLSLAWRLWQADLHELRAVSIAVLELRSVELQTADLPVLIELVRASKTWAYVDWLATKVIGPVIQRNPAARKSLGVWATDDDFWVRRTALLAWHDELLAGRGDFAQFARLARPMLGESEFFIRKAIGWVLRSTARRTPERTYEFVAQHGAEMSGLTFREATRNLSAAAQRKLAAIRGGRA